MSSLRAVGLLLVVAVVVPFIWLFAARASGMTLNAGSDPSGLVASIGGLMGTVFVVGGLVIALASLVTLFDINRRLEERVAALLPEIEKRADRQIQAHINVDQASRGFVGWKEAGALAREALTLYPDVRGARWVAGAKNSEATWGQYQWQHGFHSTFADPYGRVVAANDVPLVEAIEWLEQAHRHGEGEKGELFSRLAVMYGINARYGKMIGYARDAVNVDESWRDVLRAPNLLIALAHACGSERELGDLGETLKIALPVSVDVVVRAVEDLDVQHATLPRLLVPSMDWWVAKRVESNSDRLVVDGEFPTVVRVWRGQTGDGVGARADLLVGARVVDSWGPEPGAMNDWPSVHELVGEVATRYVFVCDSAGARGIDAAHTDATYEYRPDLNWQRYGVLA